MKACLSLVLALTLALLPPTAGRTSTAVAADAGSKVVATWMWNTYEIWRDKEGTLNYLTQHGVNLVYLQADPDIPVDVYRTFIREAGVRGIEVQALGGKPEWVLPQGQDDLYKFIYWVKAYNNSSRSSERFNGIHLDVEPYVLPQWQSERDTIIGYWMDTVSGFVQEVKSDSYLTVGVDLPVWLQWFLVPDGKGDTTTLTDYIIGRVDEIALMAYIDNATGIVQAVSHELDEAAASGKPVVIGVETMNNGEANSSFYGLGQGAMYETINSVAGALWNHPAYSGYGIHEYDSWRVLGW